MRILTQLFIGFIFAAQGVAAHAASYYLSPTGDDNADGQTPATAWRTLERLGRDRLADGGAVYFQRGAVFRGQVKFPKWPKNLHIAAYGTGQRPVIAGSVELRAWQPTAQAGVYVADASHASTAGIVHMFANGALQTIARYPNVDSPARNTGVAQAHWLKVGGKGTAGFTDPALAALGKPDGYWTGATLRIRNYSWTFNVQPVTGYTAANGHLAVAELGEQLPEWGYFLDGKREELDHPGEWWYDAAAQKVYFYPPVGSDPNALRMEGMTFERGMMIDNHMDGAVVEELEFQHYSKEGLHLNNVANVQVRHCHFAHNTTGLSVWNIAATHIADNTFQNNLEIGITLQAAADFAVQGSEIARNLLLDTAMYPGYGKRAQGIYNGIGINVSGHEFTLTENVVKNTGWVGIYLQSHGAHRVTRNVVMESLLVLNDGGNLLISSDNNQITNNLLIHAWGDVGESNGCSSTNLTPCSKHSAYGMGIGANHTFTGNLIKNNVVAHNRDMGIRLSAFTHTQVLENLLVNNDPELVLEDAHGPSANNTVAGNILISLKPDGLGLSLSNTTAHGKFDYNLYGNPYNLLAVERNKQRYALAAWQQQSGQDAHAQWLNWQAPAAIIQSRGANAYANGAFDANAQGWSPFAVHDPRALDNGGLKIPRAASGKTQSLSGGTFSIQQGQWYELRFTVQGEGYGDILLRGNRTAPDYVILAQRFLGYGPQRRDYQWLWQAPETTDAFKWLFITDEQDATYWLDNVQLTPVQGTAIAPASQARLYANPLAEVRTFKLGTPLTTLAGAAADATLNVQPFSATLLLAQTPTPPPLPVTTWLMQSGQRTTLFWTPSADATGYRLYYAPYPSATPIAWLDLGNQTQISAELPTGTAFYVAVSAYNTHGESDYSNIRWFGVP